VGDEVSVERAGRVLRLTIDRADKHNPLSRSVLARLRAILESHRNDEALACVVLTGAGDRYFAAGGDLRDLAEVREEPDVRAMAEEARAALDAVRDFPLPVIARVNGEAIGGGAELAVACDFRVMRDGAHIGYVHGRLAITSAWGGATDLCALVGPARALRMTARCELVPAATALQWGLADAAAPADGLDAALQAFIAPLFEQTATALRGCKALTRAARRGENYAALRAIEQSYFVQTWTAPPHWQAVERILARSSTREANTD
jgi:enoyl-CoA hydratase/carnithine racemase